MAAAAAIKGKLADVREFLVPDIITIPTIDAKNYIFPFKDSDYKINEEMKSSSGEESKGMEPFTVQFD